ncbi:Craniofacial development protein 2 [Eumeta japonica]|uniref:Craniofacial development protein 2 n=1 Tax=Eumeta variegata TaxID=151549 RepID=A0A4C1VIN1_EUMVA|nr:Craniofacial development protein 2 [Eumeta japonica]
MRLMHPDALPARPARKRFISIRSGITSYGTDIEGLAAKKQIKAFSNRNPSTDTTRSKNVTSINQPPSRLVTVGEVDQNPPTNLPTKSNTKKRKQDILYICTLNTRTLRTSESLLELEIATKNIKWDILGISEMRRLGEGIEERSNFIMYYKGEIAGQRGVGFLVKPRLKNQIIGFEGITDRLAVLHIKLPKYPKTWTIIQVYSPTEQATKTDIDIFYYKLSEVVETYSENNIVLMGDFNAQIGVQLPGEEYVIGKYGKGKRSKNGEKLVEFLLENNLTPLNTIFRKKPKNKWTWISPDGNTRNEIDYIITNKARSFKDTNIIQNLNFNTNHRMVRSCLNENVTKILDQNS